MRHPPIQRRWRHCRSSQSSHLSDVTAPQRQQVQPGPIIFGGGAGSSLGSELLRDSGDVDILRGFCLLFEGLDPAARIVEDEVVVKSRVSRAVFELLGHFHKDCVTMAASVTANCESMHCSFHKDQDQGF